MHLQIGKLRAEIVRFTYTFGRSSVTEWRESIHCRHLSRNIPTSPKIGNSQDFGSLDEGAH